MEIHVICPKMQAKIMISKGIIRDNVTYHVLPKICNRGRKGLILTYFVRTLFSLNKKVSSSINLIYSNSDFLPDVLPSCVWKLRNKSTKWVQVIHHIYINPFKRKGKNLLINLLSYLSQRLSFILIKKRADLIIVVNPVVKNQLLQLGFKAPKITVNYNGVDTQKIKQLKPSNKKYDCVFLGRLNVSKGIFDLPKIWEIVKEKKPNAKLAIVGGGNKPLEDELKRKVKENGLKKNIDILGYLEDEKKFGILKSSKVFVFPSYEEGFGIAALEAMACGLPVVAYDLPAYEVLGDAIVKVPVGDKEAFAEAVIRLLSDRQLRNELCEKARKVASQFDWDRIVEMELAILSKLATM